MLCLGTGVSVEAVDPVFQAKMLDMLKQTGRPEMVVGWYHSHPGFGCWLSGQIMIDKLFYRVFQVFRIRLAKNKPKTWKISTQINQNHKNIKKIPNIKLLLYGHKYLPHKQQKCLEKHISNRKKRKQMVFSRLQVGFGAGSISK